MTDPKVLLLDVDGVLILGEWFSERVAKDHPGLGADLQTFFGNEYFDCATGRGDLKQLLAPILQRHDWPAASGQSQVDAYIYAWFNYETSLNNELLDYVRQARNRGVLCALATVQERNRLNFLLDNLGFHDKFDRVFCSVDIGFSKPDPGFFKAVLHDLKGFKPDEIMFWDDRTTNVAAARGFGMRAEIYKTWPQFLQVMAP